MRKVYNKRSIGGCLFLLSAFCFLLFASCSQEEFLPQEADSDAVKISATIGKLQTRVSYDERNTTFDENDQIKVVNKLRTSKNVATYTLTDEEWNTADPFVWNGASKNEFEAWYPLTASYTTFTIPTDQSSEQLLGAADWMIASSGKIDKPEDQTLELYFLHQLSKVTVTIADWNDEFGGTAQEVSTPKIYSKGTALTATYDDSGVTITATDGETGITPLVSGTSYTAIVAPAKYATTDKFMTFTVNGQEMTVLATPSSLNEEGLQAGLHYLFNLKVGKDAVTLYGVKVTPWEEKEIDGGVAKECEHETTSNNGTCAECGKQVYVDLGLSVNWATVNIGATKPEEAGDFFAWGETEPKETYNWSTYKWCNGSNNTMTKYCTSSSYGYNGFTDNITVLDATDDAAIQNWGNGWMMPTQEQLAELRNENNCTWTWTTVNDVTGYQITSKVTGYEGNSIFIPYAKYKDDGGSTISNNSIYWTSTLYTKYDASYAALCLTFRSNYINITVGEGRFRGFLIRPVREK